MKPRHLPPVSGRFVKGRSGNPHGRPPRNLPEREILLIIAKFFETLAKAYCNQSRSVEKIRQIKDILS